MGNGYVIGIDAGGTKVAYGLFNPAGERIDRMQHPTDVCATGESFSDTLIEHIHSLLARNKMAIPDIDGIGICMPSFILFDVITVLWRANAVQVVQCLLVAAPFRLVHHKLIGDSLVFRAVCQLTDADIRRDLLRYPLA